MGRGYRLALSPPRPAAVATNCGRASDADPREQNVAVPRRPVLLALAVALLAFNLRPAVAAVGPVLPELRTDLGLSATATAVLTMLPVLCFGALAATAPRLARLVGIEQVLLVAMLLLVLAQLGRVLDGPVLMFIGTAVIGGAIAVSNVLVPPLVKRDFPEHTGTMMGVYTMAVATSAAVAAGLTVPTGELVGQGWRGALGLWALPALLAALVWLPRLRRHTRPPRPPLARSLLRSPLAWQVTLFFGIQSMMFYATLAWLPSVYRDHGYSPAAAGFLLSLSGLVQIPVTLLVPRFATRAASQVSYNVVAVLLMQTGLAGVLIAPTAAPYLWMVLLGAGAGACFALALALFVLRAEQVADTARLSAMAQTVGYLISAVGPLLVGVLYDVTGSWTPPLTVLVALGVPLLWLGVRAGRAGFISVRPEPATAAGSVTPR